MNIKEELLDRLEPINMSIKCAHIFIGRMDFILKIDYSASEYDTFLEQIDFSYDEGWGSQELFGVVWLDDDISWLDRGEYDGSEWWNLNSIPLIPENLF